MDVLCDNKSKTFFSLIRNILSIGCFLLMISCSKSDDNNEEPALNPPDKTESTTDILVGNWLLTELKEGEEGESLTDGSYMIYSITSDNNIIKYTGVDLTESTYEKTFSGEWNYNILRKTLTIASGEDRNTYKIEDISNSTLILNDSESSQNLRFRRISKSDVPTTQATPNTATSKLLEGAWELFGYNNDIAAHLPPLSYDEEEQTAIVYFWTSGDLYYFSQKENNPNEWEIDFTLKWEYNPVSRKLTIPLTDPTYDSYDYFHVCGTNPIKVKDDMLRWGETHGELYKRISLSDCPAYEPYIKSTWSRYDTNDGEFEYISIYDTSDRVFYTYKDLSTNVKVTATGNYVLTMNFITLNLTNVKIEDADEILDFKDGEPNQRHYMIRYLDTEGIMDMYCYQTGTKRFERK